MNAEQNGIIRAVRDRDNPYTMMRRGVFQDERLSWAARGIMGYLLSRPDTWTLRVDDLIAQGPAGIRGGGRDAIYAILSELRKHGYLVMETNRDERGLITGYTRLVFETPPLRADGTDRVHPLPAEPDLVEPDTVQPDLYRGVKRRDNETQESEPAAQGVRGSVDTAPRLPAPSTPNVEIFTTAAKPAKRRKPVERPSTTSRMLPDVGEPTAVPAEDAGSLTHGGIIGAYRHAVQTGVVAADIAGYALTNAHASRAAREAKLGVTPDVTSALLGSCYAYLKQKPQYRAAHLPLSVVLADLSAWQAAGRPVSPGAAGSGYTQRAGRPGYHDTRTARTNALEAAGTGLIYPAGIDPVRMDDTPIETGVAGHVSDVLVPFHDLWDSAAPPDYRAQISARHTATQFARRAQSLEGESG